MTQVIVSRTMHPSAFVVRSLRYQLQKAILKSPEQGVAYFHSSVGRLWLNAHWVGEYTSVTLSGAHADIPTRKILAVGNEVEEGMDIFLDLHKQASRLEINEVVETMCWEDDAHAFISAVATKFNLLGCGYFTQEDVEKGLEWKMSQSEFQELKQDLREFHKSSGTSQKCWSTILQNSI
ncbi:hypothetical protein IDM48_11360 (plasmid) [Rothia amarae]|uniref:Uncharacterized protein n=1 Tax=Rothia amarae TaxID=169480 RepID=A0A7S7B0Y9_9MICC|nr:hypothetical protein [Rothia amarae]QOW64938.1 hypothetical protein IDM48_11360 [Rothia amarae]